MIIRKPIIMIDSQQNSMRVAISNLKNQLNTSFAIKQFGKTKHGEIIKELDSLTRKVRGAKNGQELGRIKTELDKFTTLAQSISVVLESPFQNYHKK